MARITVKILKTFLAVIAAAGILFSSVSVCAAPQTMPDGQIFDPVFYAATYPDVAAAMGTDPGALYQHYVQFGKAEGRLPYAIDSEALKAQQAAAQQRAQRGRWAGCWTIWVMPGRTRMRISGRTSGAC